MSAETPVGKTKSQGWEIGVRRTLPLSPEQAWDAVLTALGFPPSVIYPEGEGVQKGLSFTTEDQTRVEIRSYVQYSLIRMKWQPENEVLRSTLQIRVRPAKTGTTISIHHEWLQNASQREAMRAHWTALLDRLRAISSP